MEQAIVYIALITGNLFGALMLGAVTFVYVKRQHFGLGSSVLTVFGTLLVGISVWQTAEITIDLLQYSFHDVLLTQFMPRSDLDF